MGHVINKWSFKETTTKDQIAEKFSTMSAPRSTASSISLFVG